MKGLVAVILLVAAVSAQAHDARPVYLEILAADGMLSVSLKAPDTVSRRQLPELVLPEGCRLAGDPVARQLAGAFLVASQYQCSSEISGKSLSLRYADANPSLTTLVRLVTDTGDTHTRILAPGEHHWTVPEQPAPVAVMLQYTMLGIEHILTGFDHLLFVLCLLFLARTIRSIVVTVTGFTIAHSLTLILSTLDYVAVPVLFAESVIALSIFFLALEVLQNNRASWSFRFPLVVAFGIGLLHGFGFATVLKEIGLPQSELPLALFSFNLGVEIGQLLFIGFILLAGLAVTRYFKVARAHLRVPVSYLAGSLAAYWFIDRTLAGAMLPEQAVLNVLQ